MVEEIKGAPLKFTAVFDYKRAERDIDRFYKNLSKKNRELVDMQPASKVLENIYKKSATEIKNARKELELLNKAANNQNVKSAQLATQKALQESRVEIARLKEEYQRLKNQQEQNKASVQSYRAEIERLKVAQQTLRNEFQQGLISQQQYDVQVKKNKVDQSSYNAEIAKGKIEQQKYRTELARLILEQKKKAQADREARANMKWAIGSYNDVNQRAKNLLSTIKQMPVTTDAETAAVNRKIKEYNRLMEALRKFDAQLGHHQRNVGNYTSVFDNLSSRIVELGATWLSVGTAMNVATRAFESSMRTDALQASMGFILQNGDLVTKKLMLIRTESDRLGLEYLSLAEGYRSFAGAAKASNFELDKADKVFLAVANASGKLKLSAEQTSGALTALQQMISKGNVQAEELRGQLSERIPGAFAIAARAMGVTEKELNKMLEQGQVLAADLLPKLADELNRTFGNDGKERVESLQASVNRLKNTFDIAVQEGNVSKFFKEVVDGANGALSAFTRTVNSKSWREFFLRLGNMASLGIGRGNDFSNVIFDGEEAAMLENRDQIAKQINRFNKKDEAEASRTLRAQEQIRDRAFENAKKSVADMKWFNQQQELLLKMRESFNSKFRKSVQKELKDTELTSIAAIQKRISELKKLEGSAIAGSEVNNRILALQARLKKQSPGNTGEESAIRRQRTLQRQIDELNRKATRSQLERDKEEVQSINDKYDEIEQRVKAFYADPRNKGQRVDSSGLSASRQREIDEVIAKQQLEIEKQTIEEKKILFDQYEEYKKQVGKQKANEAFKEDLEGFENYIDYLRSLMPDESDNSVKANKTRDYLNQTAIPKAQKEQQKREADLYRASLSEAQTYADKILAIQVKLEADINRLKGKASEDQLNVLRRNAREEISTITASAIKQETQWEETFAVLASLSRSSAKEWIKNAERRLDYERRSGKLTVKEYQDMVRELNEANRELDFKDPFAGISSKLKDYRDAIAKYGKDSKTAKAELKELAAVSSEAFAGVADIVGSIADSFDKLGIGNEELQETLGKVQELAGGLGELSQGIATKNPVSIITGAIKTLTSVVSLFNNRDKRLQRQIEGYETALKSLGYQYDELQRKIDNSVGKSYYDDSEAAIRNLQDQIRNLAAARDAESKKKKRDQEAIDGYNEAIRSAEFAIEDLQKSISQNLLQTDFKQLSDSLANALLSAFEAGENGIDALNQSFDNFIKNALANSLKLKLIEPLIKKMTDDLTKYMIDNDESLAGYDFTGWRSQLDKAGKDFTDALEEAYEGLGLEKSGQTKQQKGLSGAISQSITEESASKWMGIQINIYSITKHQFAEIKVHSDLMRTQIDLAKRKLDATISIERNTAAAVDRLDTAVLHLATIVNNIKPGKGLRDMGL